ncbi:MAG: hypothetical protein GY847_40485 [Proteobacteria bacterium]|nr:hypothetical protein [Pseudomonadota bacterium]
MRFFSIVLVLAGFAVASLVIGEPAGVSQPQTRDQRSLPPKQRGIALGLYSEDPNWSYIDMLDEMKAVGASHVAIVVPWYLKNAQDEKIFDHPRFTVPMHTVKRTIKDARARGMKIFLFPILRVEDQSDGGWRGVLKPRDKDAFYRNYILFIQRFAKLAEELKVPLLSVGSELSSMEVDEDRWRLVIAEVRKIYSGELTYSANWDHYEKVNFFDALDYAGVTGYFELAKKGEDPEVEELVHAWRDVYHRLMRWQHKIQKPLLFTEVGYLSQKGTAAWPWKEGADEELDLEIQRRCYEAFCRVWNGEPRLSGVYFWNWFGWGGPKSKEYTPRGKPAAKEIAKWYLDHPKNK